jgi:hypothetical protein
MPLRFAAFIIFFYGPIFVDGPVLSASIAMAEQIFTNNSASPQTQKCSKLSRKSQSKDCAKIPVKKGTKSNRPKLKTPPKPPDMTNDPLPEKGGDRF